MGDPLAIVKAEISESNNDLYKVVRSVKRSKYKRETVQAGSVGAAIGSLVFPRLVQVRGRSRDWPVRSPYHVYLMLIDIYLLPR